MPCPHASWRGSRALCLGQVWPGSCLASCSKYRKICATKSENQEPGSCRNPFFTIKTLPVFAIPLIYCSILLTHVLLNAQKAKQTCRQSGVFQIGILPQALLEKLLLQTLSCTVGDTWALPPHQQTRCVLVRFLRDTALQHIQQCRKGDVRHMGTTGHLLPR